MQPATALSVRRFLWFRLHSCPLSASLACGSILVHTPVYPFTVSLRSDVSFISIESASVLIHPQHKAQQLRGTSCVCEVNEQTPDLGPLGLRVREAPLSSQQQALSRP